MQSKDNNIERYPGILVSQHTQPLVPLLEHRVLSSFKTASQSPGTVGRGQHCKITWYDGAVLFKPSSVVILRQPDGGVCDRSASCTHPLR